MYGKFRSPVYTHGRQRFLPQPKSGYCDLVSKFEASGNQRTFRERPVWMGEGYDLQIPGPNVPLKLESESSPTLSSVLQTLIWHNPIDPACQTLPFCQACALERTKIACVVSNSTLSGGNTEQTSMVICLFVSHASSPANKTTETVYSSVTFDFSLHKTLEETLLFAITCYSPNWKECLRDEPRSRQCRSLYYGNQPLIISQWFSAHVVFGWRDWLISFRNLRPSLSQILMTRSDWGTLVRLETRASRFHHLQYRTRCHWLNHFAQIATI